jgi:hypothetical protein
MGSTGGSICPFGSAISEDHAKSRLHNFNQLPQASGDDTAIKNSAALSSPHPATLSSKVQDLAIAAKPRRRTRLEIVYRPKRVARAKEDI